MGNAVLHPVGDVDIPKLLREDLPSYVKERVLGNGRLFKTIKCTRKLHIGNDVCVVKVFLLRDLRENLASHQEQLETIRDSFNLLTHPNVYPFQNFISKSRAVYMVRQYFYSSLYHRISTRPFLLAIEKKWIAFQLLFALSQMHGKNVCHGDIKSENVLVTSWNWVLLSDLAPFKPVLLPSDHPAEFSVYFDTSGRRSCYIAPERFYDSKDQYEEKLEQANFDLQKRGVKPAGCIPLLLTPAMDIFSAGCVIAEIFLNGTPLFDLSQLLAYRDDKRGPRGDLEREGIIHKIEDPYVRSLVTHMTDLDPSNRFSADQYVREWTGKAFPPYFNSVLHSMMARALGENSPDAKLVLAEGIFPRFFNECRRCRYVDDRSGASSPDSKTAASQRQIVLLPASEGYESGSPAIGGITRSRYYSRLGVGVDSVALSNDEYEHSEAGFLCDSPDLRDPSSPSLQPSFMSHGENKGPPTEFEADGCLLFLGLVLPSSRSAQRASSKLIAVDLIRECAVSVGDAVIMSRIVPYLLDMMQDLGRRPPTFPLVSSSGVVSFEGEDTMHGFPVVRAACIRLLSNVLASVRHFNARSDASVFQEYILPTLLKVQECEVSDAARMALAESLALLAETSQRFLDTSEVMLKYLNRRSASRVDSENLEMRQDDDDFAFYQGEGVTGYEAALHKLREGFCQIWLNLFGYNVLSTQSFVGGGHGASRGLSATSHHLSLVKLALMKDVTRLCVFLGEKRTNNVILPLLISVLNDRDWETRHSFLTNIVGISALVGSQSLHRFILPCILDALMDEEEFVVERALTSLTSLSSLGLFHKKCIVDIAKRAVPLTCHPSSAVRFAAVSMFVAIAKSLCVTDVYCFLTPVLEPFMSHRIIELTETSLLETLLPPLRRAHFDQAMNYFMKDSHKRESDAQSMPSDHLFPRLSLDSAPDCGEAASETAIPMHSTPSFDQSDTNRGTPPNRLPPSSPDKNLSPSDSGGICLLGIENLSSEDAHLLRHMKAYIEDTSKFRKGRRMTDNASARDERLRRNYGAPRHLHMEKFIDRTSFFFPPLAPAPDTGPSHEWKALFGDMQPEQSSDNASADDILAASTGPAASTSSGKYFGNTSTILSSSDDIYKLNDQAETRKSLGIPALPPDMGALKPHRVGGIDPLFRHDVDGSNMESNLKSKWDGWRPRGILVASLHEHDDAINSVDVSQDGLFFATGSSDGTVKIWDCQRLETDVISKSRLTYADQGGKIVALKICENTHSVASASSLGTVHVFKVEYVDTGEVGAQTGYSGLSTIKKIDVHDNGENGVLALDHFNTDSHSLVVYSTVAGKIHGWDLRAKREAWCLQNSSSMGLFHCLAIDPHRYWLCSGSDRGYLTCWDLRFQVMATSWRHPAGHRINDIWAHPSCQGEPGNLSSGRPWVLTASGDQNEVCVWDIESAQCVYIYRGSVDKKKTEVVEWWKPDFHSNKSRVNTAHPHQLGLDALNIQTAVNPGAVSVRAILIPPGCSYMLTAGTDRKLRVWPLNGTPGLSNAVIAANRNARPVCSECCCIDFEPQDPTATTLGKDPSPLSYLSHKPTLFRWHPPSQEEAVVLEEVVSDRPLPMESSRPSSMYGGLHPPSAQPRDAILSLACTDFPQRFLITGCRDGTIGIWK